ncbi:UNVERIFIED_CONTAM: hypothetical protein Sangu_0381300 [Sesamum angustifolium]|uniref:Transposase n=1 Tax=Sesamum angustifolium TaxID=2727405 RepID=A0AAW2QRI6_9LAMI
MNDGEGFNRVRRLRDDSARLRIGRIGLGSLVSCWRILGIDKWSFISERQKGLVEALRELAPESEHRYCIKHIYENLKQKFKGTELKEYFWKPVSIANKQEFRAYMKKIADQETTTKWLNKIASEHWSRVFFLVKTKCDILVNNLCETFNNYILDARDKPTITMLEWIITKLMTRLQHKRFGMEKYEGIVCPNVLKKINKQGKLLLDIALAAIADMRHQIEDYVDSSYKKPTYLKVYENMIHGVPGQEEYIQIGSEPSNSRKKEVDQ